MDTRKTLHWGIQLHPQYTDWAALRRTALLVESLGYDSLWTWDHLMAHIPLPQADRASGRSAVGQPDGPNFEAWQVLAAWAGLTSRVQIGSLVTSNTHRHPALVANMTATLDNISGGRAILGLGAGGLVDEQLAFGMPPDSLATRVAKLAEATDLIHRLFDGERVTLNGNFYQVDGIRISPRPVQRRIPLLIAGGRKTIGIVSEYADLWNCPGTPQEVALSVRELRRQCEKVRDRQDDVTVTVMGEGLPGFVMVAVRDDKRQIDLRLNEVAKRYQMDFVPPRTATMGNPDEVAQRLSEYCAIGVDGFIIGVPTPYDEETIERLAKEVRPRVEALRGGRG